MRTATLVLVAMFIASATAAAEVDGRWQGHVDTSMGPVPVAFVFKANGATLTGTTMSIDGTEIPVRDGKIAGNAISFAVDVDVGGMPAELAYRGVVSSGAIKFRATFMGVSLNFTVTKVKQ